MSCDELDASVDAARAAGALGARMTGGGFGGSTVALCPADRADSIAAAVEDATRSGGFPVPTIYATSAQDGARKVQLHL